MFAPENALPFKKRTLEADTFSLSSLLRWRGGGRIFFFTAFLCFLQAHSIHCSVKRKSKGFNSIKNCSDYAMQFCSHHFITICHSSGHCCASSSEGEAPSTAARSFHTRETLVQSEHVSSELTSSLCIINQWHETVCNTKQPKWIISKWCLLPAIISVTGESVALPGFKDTFS